MQILKNPGIALAFLCATNSFAHNHQHVEHNMVLYGVEEIHVSHIVYKKPHNYQVILRIELPTEARAIYRRELAAQPGARFIYFLDRMHIADIASVTELSGTLYRVAVEGSRVTLARSVRIPRDQFTIVFFNELPESLSTGSTPSQN